VGATRDAYAGARQPTATGVPARRPDEDAEEALAA